MLTKAEYERILALEAFGETRLPPGFGIDEIVVPGTHNRQMPPEEAAKNMAGTLRHAYALRERHKAACRAVSLPFSGLYLKAAYRPFGGAPRSKHKYLGGKGNRALDLCVMVKDWSDHPMVKAVWYETGAVYWYEQWQAGHPMGMGMYCLRGKTSGVQLHIDTRPTATLFQIQGLRTPVLPACGYEILRRLGYPV